MTGLWPLLAVPLLGGCATLLGGSTSNTTTSTPPKDRCAQVFAVPTGEQSAKGATVLLADGSASSHARGGPARRQDWGTLLAARFPKNAAGVLVEVGVFGGAVDWKFQKMTPGRSSDQARTDNDMTDARACFGQDLTSALASPATHPQTDVLRALAQAADQVRSSAGSKWVYIATDGLSNTGCADMRAAAIDDLSAIDAMVQGCAQELPKLDRTFHVQFIGLGYPGDGWPDVKTPDRTWVVEVWRKMCAATGADCSAPDTQAPTQITGGVAAPLDDAAVPMPKIVVKQGNPTVLTVPASMLFDIDSADLASGRSQQALAEILQFLGSVHHTRVDVAGYTDSTGPAQHNRDLSNRRAEAVARALQDRGVTGLTAHGYGSQDPACTPEYHNGVPDRINMACNRRVEVSVYI